MAAPALVAAAVSLAALRYSSDQSKITKSRTPHNFSSKLGDNLQTQVEPIHEAGVNLDQRIDTKDPRVVAAAYKEYLMSKQLLQASEPDLAVIRSSL